MKSPKNPADYGDSDFALDDISEAMECLHEAAKKAPNPTHKNMLATYIKALGHLQVDIWESEAIKDA